MASIRSSLTIASLLILTSGIIPLGFQFPLAAKELDTNTKIARYRARGYAGIDEFLKTNGAEMARLRTQTNSPRWKQLSQTLDRICQQRDCEASRLYWHTDLAQAKQVAAATNKPILSLRMLGNLDEELSCANSRFFRITLYSNPEIAKLLRDKYVLHWQSVRPVPKITIDFGDGRKVQQTITGNSIHYILDKTGHPIDGLPGLYAPQAFKRQLTQGAEFVAKYHQLPEKDRQTALDTYHQTQLANLQANWQRDLDKLGISIPLPKSITSLNTPPTAAEAGGIAVSKSAIESPIIQLSRAFSQRTDILKKATEDPLWVKLGELHQEDATLAANSRALIRRKQPQLASLAAKDKENYSDPLPELVTKFQKLMAIDSIRNEYLLHSQLHQWLMGNRFPVDIETLNTRVYDRLFLTPKSDRWLGLMPGDGYTGIDRDGIVEN
ncbi:hypothetical protein [Chamaesiphon minutus]|uniref:Uncharacterized protein n=1 Tax=Chamaesiphon minutus (strain ATCC 27169 / PCC 6605) TaxID=1173020 RepID=K9U976_CHAP6|nr:hypothetical protein [Chamaesiphon minutus]AFY91365.1 hypothetical protein Cha6605_0058 [Chamaesiphon minutus PCC 6605]